MSAILEYKRQLSQEMIRKIILKKKIEITNTNRCGSIFKNNVQGMSMTQSTLNELRNISHKIIKILNKIMQAQ